MTISADFYPATKTRAATLDVYQINNGQRAWVAIGLPVKDKREARAVAAQYNAQPWNF